MAGWVLVPSLVALRGEFNRLAPTRDKASDGSIGDPNHAARSSDHNPDDRGFVHAIDIDNTGPWPGRLSMERLVQTVVARHRTGRDDRLQNVIYNRRIWSRSWGWTSRVYDGVNPHNHHAHFSCRYDIGAEISTRPWGLLELLEGEMDWDDDVITNPEWRADATKNPTVKASFAIYDAWNQAHTAMVKATAADQKLNQVLVLLRDLTGRDFTDEPAIVGGVLAGLSPEAIAAAIPTDIARQVADELASRLQV